ncbi:hypothetical protein BDC45DRAFT_520994 [Circinella umbellata]|nr:hypothetical protein BDC45DRAFT_520994 [Circinella umbellata]
MVACSLPQIKQLELNRYGNTTNDTLWPFEQRDHLYQMRPSHNLSSLAMDMSKVPSMSLTLSESTLQFIVGRCSQIESLSLRYQHFEIDSCRAIAGRLHHLTHLDISSCIITQPVLQMLLKNCGKRLLSLKMLNIELTNLTLLCMQQYAKNLKQLHLSCQEPQVLVGIIRTLERFHTLEDFRLTQLRTGGNVDEIVEKLNPASLRRLDLSPKLDFHPRYLKSSPTTIATGGGGARLVSPCASPSGTLQRRRSTSPINNGNMMHSLNKKNNGNNRNDNSSINNGNDIKSSSQQQQKLQLKQLQRQQLSRTEHQLYLTDRSLATLCNFKGLVELRLCYPVVSKSALTQLFTCVPNLEILELRMEMRKAAACSSSSSPILSSATSVAGGIGGTTGGHHYLSLGDERLLMQQKKKKKQAEEEEEKIWQDQDEDTVDVLRGLLPSHVPRLRELSLYHSWISTATARTIGSLSNLRKLTVYNCGKIVDREPELIRRWLTSLHLLQVLRLGRVGHIRCDLLDDIATPTDPSQSKHISRLDDEFIFTHHPLILSSSPSSSFLSGQWRWRCTNY